MGSDESLAVVKLKYSLQEWLWVNGINTMVCMECIRWRDLLRYEWNEWSVRMCVTEWLEDW